jgi:hypothetical protein
VGLWLVLTFLVANVTMSLYGTIKARTQRPTAVGGVVLKYDSRDIARFINAASGERIVMACRRRECIIPAITNPAARVVGLQTPLLVFAPEVTHAAFPMTGHYAPSAEALRAAQQDGTLALVMETDQVRIFRVLSQSPEAGPGSDGG